MPPAYLQRLYDLPASLEDDFSAALWLAGTLGVHSVEAAGRVRLEAWFEPGAEEVDDGEGWRARGVTFLGEETAPSRDWLASFRDQAQPFPVGERFYVDPREPEDAISEAPDGRVLLRLPARTAFGIGSHESTALALELVESYLAEEPDDTTRVLDVGTGTGILCFGALILAHGTESTLAATGFDNDPQAVFQARENARLNAAVLGEARPALFVGTGESLAEAARFDLVLVNVVPEEILPAIPGMVARLAEGGSLIFSGILRERGPDLVRDLEGLGLFAEEIRLRNEWVAFRFFKPEE